MKRRWKLKYKRKMKPMSKQHKLNISLSLKGHPTSLETKIKIGNANRGKKYGEMTKTQRKKISNALKGKIPKFIPNNKGRKHSKVWIENWKKSRTFAKGSAHHNWKGGVTSENHRIRTSASYTQWRIAVFERDRYTCVWCGQKGGKIEADHIKPFSLYPEFRFDISNGRTLCKSCHRKTDTHSFKIKNYVKNL